MKTRIKNLLAGFSFQYAEGKRPTETDWHFVGGDAAPRVWKTAQQRGRARMCFSRRKSVEVALSDLKAVKLL
jgi:hypothetical protein